MGVEAVVAAVVAFHRHHGMRCGNHIPRYGIKGNIDGNKSIYVSLVSYEGIFRKKTT